MTTSSHLSADRRSTVLLIGNGLGILKRIAFALQRQGHTIIWGETAHDGLRIAENEEPDLIVCETRLPDITGIEVCRMIKSSFFFETPFVLVGKDGDEGIDLPRAFKAGADDYISSFTDSQLVMAKLEQLVQRRECENPSYRIENRSLEIKTNSVLNQQETSFDELLAM